MTVAEMKPRDLGDIVNETFKIYRINFLRLIAIVAIIEVILYLLNWVWLLPLVMTEGNIDVLVLFIVIAVILVVSFVAYALIEGALIHAVSEQSLGRTIGIGRAYGFA